MSSFDDFIIVGLGLCMLLICGCIVCEANAYKEAFACGNAVETTAEYTDIFGDQFSGHIICRSTVWVQMITVRNATGDERTFAAKWLEPAG